MFANTAAHAAAAASRFTESSLVPWDDRVQRVQSWHVPPVRARVPLPRFPAPVQVQTLPPEQAEMFAVGASRGGALERAPQMKVRVPRSSVDQRGGGKGERDENGRGRQRTFGDTYKQSLLVYIVYAMNE